MISPRTSLPTERSLLCSFWLCFFFFYEFNQSGNAGTDRVQLKKRYNDVVVSYEIKRDPDDTDARRALSFIIERTEKKY